MRLTARTPLRGPFIVVTFLIYLGGGISPPRAVRAGEESAWLLLPAHEHGDDLAPLLAIEREGREGRATSEGRAAFAARLAAVLDDPAATAAARQWICLALGDHGTAAEVPALARLLATADAATADAARQGLEGIGGPAAAVALRAGLDQAQGDLRLGIIAALGRRRDTEAVPQLVRLAAVDDRAVARAAVAALGAIGDQPACDRLAAHGLEAGVPTPAWLVSPLMRVAAADTATAGSTSAAVIRELLARPGQPVATRTAALRATLDSAPAGRDAAVLAWLADDDAERRDVARAALAMLNDAALRSALDQIAGQAPATQQTVLTAASRRIPEQALPFCLRLADERDREVRLTAIECLGRIGTAEAVPGLLTALRSGHQDAAVGAAARAAIAELPAEIVAPRLLAAVRETPADREVLAVLCAVGDRTSLPVLVATAAAAEPTPWREALAAIQRIALPEPGDLGVLVDLFARAPDEPRREEIARVIVAVLDRAGDEPARTAVLAASDARGIPATQALPLFGRLGVPAARARIDAALGADDAAVRDAAIKGLCNWPAAEVAPELLTLARELAAEPGRQPLAWQCLRASVRAATRPGGLAAAERLDFVREAMAAAVGAPAVDRGFLLERAAATIRTPECFDWVASFLDDAELGQAAARSVIALARDRALRQSHRDQVQAALTAVMASSADAAIVLLAERRALGL
jgi:HEAT repeat protein